MSVNTEHLPASLRRSPQVRALSLRVYRESENTFKVPGNTRIYSVFRAGDKFRCNCTAGANGRVCAHALACERLTKGQHEPS